MPQKVLNLGYHKAVPACSMLFPFVAIGTTAIVFLMHARNIQGTISPNPLLFWGDVWLANL
jgi:hypothetical protein